MRLSILLYWASAVIIISTTIPVGTTKLILMSAWWLGQRCILGLDAESQTTIELLQTKQCVLNLPVQVEVKPFAVGEMVPDDIRHGEIRKSFWD